MYNNILDNLNILITNVLNKFNFQNYNKITENIYLGNYKASELEKFDIVINCTDTLPFLNKSNRKNYRLSVKDDISFKSQLDFNAQIRHILRVIRKYDLQNKKILVHCYSGMQRSASVIVCYLIAYNNYNDKNAINYVKSKRKIAFLFIGSNFLPILYIIYDKNAYLKLK